MNNNSLSEQLENLNLNQLNVLKLSSAYLEAITTNKKIIDVELELPNGEKQKVSVPSNVALGHEIKRMQASINSLSGLKDVNSAIVSDDGSFRQIFVGNRQKTPKDINFLDINLDSDIKIVNNPIIEQLMSPLTQVEIILPSGVNCSKVKITKILLKDGDAEILEDGMTYQKVMDKLNNTVGVSFSQIEYDTDVYNPNVRFHGSFNVIERKSSIDDGIVVNMESVLYNDALNSVEKSKELVVGDRLVNANGSCEYVVDGIDENIVKLSHVSGVGLITIGDDSLYLNNQQNDNLRVRVPVRMFENSAIFISEINDINKVAGVKSKSKVFKSDKFTVNVDGVNETFDNYFSTKVSDISAYFSSILQESIMPASFGAKPDRPNVNEDDFSVVQINKHITNSTTLEKLKKLNSDKETIKSQLDSMNNSINKLSTKITKGNYSVESKSVMDNNQLKKLVNDKNQKTKMLTSTTEQIKTLLIGSVPKTKPKYRVRGFWEVQSDLVGGDGSAIKIVQYQIRHRYLSTNGKTANADQHSFTSEEGEKSGIFTPWIYEKSEPLERKIGLDGKISWVDQSESNADVQNINQLDIPINSGESVEFQIMAISEAGYPNSAVTSDWSKKIRVEYPESYDQNTDVEVISKNNEDDALMVRLSQEFENQGITEHISKSFKEQDKYYAHNANQIASGHVTSEQKSISQYDHTVALEQRIRLLEEVVNRRYAQLTLQMLDDDAYKTSDVNNHTTIKLFAGYYTDSVDLTDTDSFGDIITKKFYLRVSNNNAQTAEILSIDSGNLTMNTQNSKYNNVPIHLFGSNEIFPQKRGQIFYNRNVDLTRDENLYVEGTDYSINTIVDNDIDSTAQEAAQNIVHRSGVSVSKVALMANAGLESYVAMTTAHPSYQSYLRTGNDTEIQSEFVRITRFNHVYRDAIYQNELSDDAIVRFSKNDKHLVGKNSVGATLYTSINNIESFQVDGIDSGSSKQIFSGDQDSVLIPIEFQFRMSDALGNPNGSTALNTNAQFEYQKKIGFDVLLKGKLFSFDVLVSAQFRPTNSAVNKLGIQRFNTNTLTSPTID